MTHPSPRVAVNMVTWNSAGWLPDCLAALARQTLPSFTVTVVDNASTDETLDILRAWEGFPIRLICNENNRGFAPAHNQALEGVQSEAVLLLNPDVILAPDFLAEMLAVLEENAQVGSVSGKLLQISPEQFHNWASLEGLAGCMIDSAGLRMRRSRRQELLHHQQPADAFALEAVPIFGPDGAAPLYRRAMLEDVKIEGEVLDELFVTHKEDVDLAWRAQLMGWESHFTPRAVAYHVRGFRPGRRAALSASVKRDAVKNRWLMGVKNEIPALFWRDLPFIATYEAGILAYMLLAERSSLPAISDFFRLLPAMRRRRKLIQARRRRSAAQMKRWFTR